MKNTELLNMIIDRMSNFELDIRDPFGEFTEETNEMEGDVASFQDAIRHIFDDYFIEFMFGASKVVMICDEWDFVVKVPFNCEKYFDDYTYEADQEASGDAWLDPDGYITVNKFYGADSETGWDYCDAEVNKYYNAEEAGVAQYFAETEFLCYTKGGYPVYIQEKCVTDLSTAKPASAKSKEIAKSRTYENTTGGIDSVTWVACFIDTFGEKEFDKLTKFTESDDDIKDDLHYRNVGYTMSGQPIIIDYAGFNS